MKVIHSASLQKGVATSFADLPTEWQSATFAPGFPIQPFTRPEESIVPREIDYPLAVNASITPRTGFGLMPFSALSSAYENIAEIRIPVQTILRELTGFRPRLIDKDQNEIFNHPYSWLCTSPDRITPYDVWQARFLKSSYIFDAGAAYIETDGNNLQALHYIDGSTLFIIVDEHGRVPLPQDRSTEPEIVERYLKRASLWKAMGKQLPTKTPAYAQVIKGTPFGWYSQDEVWYKPRSRRYNAPYGESFIEQSWAWVLIVANITAFELAHYREGNMPEGWWESPPDWTFERIVAFEDANNRRMSSGPAERMRSRFYPAGFKWHETKKADFPVKLYEQARDTILNAIGLPPSEIGKVPGMGLGGKGFGEVMQSALFRNALMPPRSFVISMFNDILDRFDAKDVRFDLSLPTTSVDPDKHREGIIASFAGGLLTLNDALGQLGMAPVDGGDIRIVIQGGKVIVVDDYLKGKRDPNEGELEDKKQEAAPAANQVAPVPAKQEPEGTFQPGDIERAREILQNKSITTTTWSISKGALDHPRDFGGKFAPKGGIDTASAREIMQQHGVSLDPDQFVIGYNEESGEHHTVGPDVIAQLVIDHLTENADYYRRTSSNTPVSDVPTVVTKVLTPEFEKHCGVCPEDDEYYRAPVVREASFEFPSHDEHANHVEIVMMTPEGLPPKPALWKPEGGESDILREKIGGPLYPREEVAYLLDRSLGFNLVPVAYTAELGDEMGAVIYYTHGLGSPKAPSEYDPAWVFKAGVLDYAMAQLDRHLGHNYGTHPDDEKRIILIDNSFSCPNDPSIFAASIFSDAAGTETIPDEIMASMVATFKDAGVWGDISELIGDPATAKVKLCLQHMIEWKAVHNPQEAPRD